MTIWGMQLHKPNIKSLLIDLISITCIALILDWWTDSHYSLVYPVLGASIAALLDSMGISIVKYGFRALISHAVITFCGVGLAMLLLTSSPTNPFRNGGGFPQLDGHARPREWSFATRQPLAGLQQSADSSAQCSWRR